MFWSHSNNQAKLRYYEKVKFLKVFSKLLIESNLFLLQGVESIPAREVGYILRSLGQNPTEDEINNLICEAGCDWEVSNFCLKFLSLGQFSQLTIHNDKTSSFSN